MNECVLFTGTFDPFHKGHILQLERAFAARPYSNVVVAVIERNPKKPQAVAFEHRVNLAQLTLSSLQMPFRWSVETITGITSADLTVFIAAHEGHGAKWRRIIGSDSLMEFAHDNQLRLVLELFEYTVLLRPQNSIEEVQAAINYVRTHSNAQFDPEVVELGDEHKHLKDISARNVRAQLEESGQQGLLVPAALEYMRKHRLYTFSE